MATTNAGAADGGEGDVPGEAQLLVSEFPPPPFYYKQASSLVPPLIPTDALERGTRRAAAAAAKARAESVRIRLGEDTPNSDAILGGTPEDEEGDVVAVFGEIVEDPYLVEVQDLCEDPRKIRDEVHRLNREVVQLFVGLVKDLVNRPLENKKRRDELSHNTFLMLQECNKFREHQAREVLIELLEKQLVGRSKALSVLKEEVQKANDALGMMET
ncbi:hypothetical protein MHU86_4232 [Fragilaria crotonensis]|nr:hypothetical protein MHU86_4232 [Fragilaria crotonensis]